VQKFVFVAREGELAKLNRCLDKALSGTGQVCLISGQAGTGKTALVRAFLQQALASHPELVAAMGTCNAQTGIGDPYLPFREALTMLTDEVAAQQAAGKVSPENTNRLRTGLVRSVQVLIEVAPELVGVLVPGASLVGAVGEAVAKKTGWMDRLDELAKRKAIEAKMADVVAEQSRIFEQYTAFVRQLSAKIPLILFLDDLQWADGASLNLLFHLGRRLENSRVLILGAYRPDDVALGRGGERHPLEPVVNELTRYYGDVTVDLDAIPEETSRAFVEALLDAEPNCMGYEFREALYERTGGHALFTVELIHTMKDRGDLVLNGDGCWVEGPSLNWSTLPSRVEGVIEERIARLPQELREMLQVASVQGETFNAEIVARVQNMADREAIWQLSRELQRRHRLVSASGLIQIGRVRLSRYHFVHNLFQHYLYDSLSEAERFYLHRNIGEVLEGMFTGQTEEVAAQLAHHFERASIPEKAAAYRLQAGNRARRVSAHHEAAEHLTRGLELAADLAPGPERMQLELDLQISLGKALLALYGYASPKVDQVFTCARDLCQALGDPPQLIQVLLAQAAFHLMRGDLRQAQEDAQQVFLLAQQAEEDRLVLTSHLLLGAAALYLADYDQAREHLEKVIALYDPAQHRALAYQQGQDPGVQAIAFLSRTLWLQGFPEQSLAKCGEAAELAEQLDHPYSSTVAALHAATLRAWLRWWPSCQTHAERALDLARQGGFAMREANAIVLQGIALAHQGYTQEGIDRLGEGLFLWEASGAGLVVYGRACLAEAYLLAGQQEAGLRAADESLYPSEETWWLPEQYRLRAELLLQTPGAEAEAEALLRKAADLAKSQKARSLELRALTSLTRLQSQQGRKADGLDRLARCYAAFTEGFDLPDLRDAEALLADLRRQPSETVIQTSPIAA
jgi:tetratricopeptide (TPR) repeat protein